VSDILGHALAFHNAGCSVIPAAMDGTKAPWPDGPQWKAYQSARAGEDRLGTWFAEGGYTGLGIVCGAVSGNLDMLEFEGRAVTEGLLAEAAGLMMAAGLGEIWQKLVSGYMETSPSGGVHFCYRLDGAAVPGNTKLAGRPAREEELTAEERVKIAERAAKEHQWWPSRTLIETRGEGGFVVVAPSHGRVHPSGRPWVLASGSPDTIPLLPAAEREELVRVIRSLDQMPAPEPSGFTQPGRPRRDPSDGKRPGEDYSERADWADILSGWTLVATLRDGTRNWRRPGKKLGMSATTGRPPHDNLYVFSTSTEFDPQTPYTKFGAYALLEHGGDYKAASAQLGREGYGEQPKTPRTHTSNKPESETSADLTSGSNGSNGSDSGVEYELRDGPWLDIQKFPPLRYTVPGLMPAGFGIIAAPPKAGKSLLILDWLLAVASGGPALGALPASPPHDVLYLALEDGDRRLQARCRHLLAAGEQIPDRFRYILTIPPGQVLAVIADALDRHPETALIVIDTLGRIMPLPMQGETTYQRDYRVAVALKRIADEHPGLAIIVIHHTRKAFSDDFIDSISGTHGLAGAADTIITLSRGRGKSDGTLQVTGRDVMEASYAVTFHGGVWALDGDTLQEARANVSRRADTAALSGRSGEILEFIRQQPGGAKASDVTGKFGKEAATYLSRLTDSGRLVKPKRGLYVVSEPSEVSETQVSDGAEPDTGLLEVLETHASNTSNKNLFVVSDATDDTPHPGDACLDPDCPKPPRHGCSTCWDHAHLEGRR
jgi:hypothetical protein